MNPRLTNPARVFTVGTAKRITLLLSLLTVLASAVAFPAGRAQAEPIPAPTPSQSAPAVDAACAAKAPGQVAWCMPWAIHVDNPPKGAVSHWVTDCSKASEADRWACSAASFTIALAPRPGTPSVLMDGPSTNGLAALVNCALLADTAAGTSGQPSVLNDKQRTCAATAAAWAAQSYDPRPTVACGTIDVPCQVSKGAQEAVGKGIRSGIEGLIDLCVQGVVVMLSGLAGIVFTSTAIAAPDDAFYSTYNAVAGVLILLIFVLFIVSTIINGLRVNAGPGPLSTLGGLVRAILGVTFAGGIAYTIVAAWDQATLALLTTNAQTGFTGREWSNAFTALAGDSATVFLGFLLSILALLGLLPLFVMMLFRGVLATGAALFGAWAMAGQAMSETRHWGRRWFWTVNALASSKFAIAALWVYGSRAVYESQLWTALQAVLLIWLMVFAPYILLRLTSMWDGYLSDVNAHGLIAQANPLGFGADFMNGLQQGSDGSVPSGPLSPGPDSGAASTMSANSAALPTMPGKGLAEAAGGDGPNSEAAADAATGADGGKVGEPPAAGEQSDAGETPNADEADGVEAGLRSARSDVAAADPAPSGSATGVSGGTPAGPPPAAPGGQPPGSATGSPETGGSPGAGSAADSSGGASAPRPAAGAGSSGGSAGQVASELPIVPI